MGRMTSDRNEMIDGRRRAHTARLIVLALAGTMMSGAAARADTDAWTNTTKRVRSEAALNADVNVCSRRFATPQDGTETPTKFKQCMRGRGWRYASATHEDAAPASEDWSSPTPDSPAIDNSASDAAIQQMNDTNALNASTAAAQQQFNDGMAAGATDNEQCQLQSAIVVSASSKRDRDQARSWESPAHAGGAPSEAVVATNVCRRTPEPPIGRQRLRSRLRSS